MSEAHIPFRPEALLEQREFLRSLARSLLSDEHGAEDVVQDAWIAALENPPRSSEALRAWLARVTRNLSLNTLRERERRARREELAARSDTAPSEEEVDARLRAQRRVVEAVLALREPYKSAIWMRWYENLPPREIARRTGVPIETVKSRLKRGLAELKSALDREFGDRASWCSALAPLALRDAAAVGAPTLVIGGALVLFLATVFAVVALRRGGRGDIERPHAVHLPTPDAPAPGTLGARDDRVSASLAIEPLAEARSILRPNAMHEPGALRCRAIDVRTLEPLNALSVEWIGADGAKGATATEANGFFELADVRDERAADLRLMNTTDSGLLEIVERVWIQACGIESGYEELRLAIGPTYALAFDPPVGLLATDFSCVLELAGDPGDGASALIAPVREGSPPWVRFARAPRTSLLGASGRSTYTLRLASRDGLWLGEARVIASDGAHGKPVRFPLQACARIDGRVIAADGSPVAGARVRLANELDGGRATSAHPAGAPAEAVREMLSDAGGRWTLGAIPSGGWHLSVHSPAHFASDQELSLAPLEDRALEVTLAPRPTTTLEGLLTSTSGLHVPHGVLRLRSASERDLAPEATPEVDPSSAQRRDHFRFEAVPPGEYELFPPMEDALAWDPPSLVLTVPGSTVRFTCRDDAPLMEVALRAVDDDTGLRIARFHAAILLDRYDLGRRKATAIEPHPRWIEARAGEALFDGIPRNMRGWWLVECEGRRSAWGELADLGRDGARLCREARLAPAWTCRLWIGAADERGRTIALNGARIQTSGGKLLATSLEDGDALIDLLYDPGRLSIELDGWRVKRWEGFTRGKLRTPLDVHRVWMERDE